MAEEAQDRQEGGRRGRRRVRRARIPKVLFVITAIVLLGVIIELALSVARIVRSAPATNAQEAGAPVEEQEAAPAAQAGRVTFAAVGDNLINAGGDYTVDLLGMADAWSGATDDGSYDFSPIYAQLSPTIGSADIALINQETVLGGTDQFEYQGYPSYNTPDEVAWAVADAGFDVVNCGTNHTYDMWTDCIEHALDTWSDQNVAVIGSYASETDRSDIRVIERNGVRVAFLAYCYGQNGYTQADLPNDYYVAPMERDRMREDVERAKEIADAVVVYMHWGEENSHDLTEEQRDYATYLAGLGVDLVVGSHAHVIQPVEYVARGIRTTDGSGADASNGMLCVYGLGDFVSGYTLPAAILSGMFTCDIVVDDAGDVSIENPVWHALVEHCDGETDSVYALSTYTDELAAENQLLDRVGEDEDYGTADRLEWARQTTYDVVGDAIAIEA